MGSVNTNTVCKTDSKFHCIPSSPGTQIPPNPSGPKAFTVLSHQRPGLQALLSPNGPTDLLQQPLGPQITSLDPQIFSEFTLTFFSGFNPSASGFNFSPSAKIVYLYL